MTVAVSASRRRDCGGATPLLEGAGRAGGLLLVLVLFTGMLQAACSARPATTAPAGPVTPAVPAASAAAVPGNRFPANLVLSVLYFDDRTGQPELAWLRKGMADMLVAEFARMPSLLVMQRDRMEEVFREQAFQLSGRVADESVVRVGRIAGATVIVTGSVSVVDGRLRIDAQLQGVEQGTVLGTASAEGRLTEVASTAKTLVAKVVELLPSGGERRVAAEQEGGPGQGSFQSAKANDAGEVLTRQGKVFQALEEFERAVAADPLNPSARSNYSQAVRKLTGTDLLRTSASVPSLNGDRQVVARVVERLAGSGFEAQIGAAQADPAADGTMTVRLPVQIRLSAPAVEAVLESTRSMGGRSDTAPPANRQADATLDLTLAQRQDLNREFTRQLTTPRRLYLRLLSTDGRTIALYSGWREWQVSKWIAPLDDQRVQIKPDRVLAAEAVFAGLAPEQVGGVAGARLTVEPAGRERSMLRLEAVEQDAGPRASAHQPPLQWGQWQEGPEPRTLPPPLPGREQPGDLQTLRNELEQAWNPPVTERGWGRGYLPSNERTATVLAVIEPGAGLHEDPRLAKPSGDREFDGAAIAATRQALQRWMAGPTAARPGQAPSGQAEVGQSAKDGKDGRVTKIRVQFRLLKEIPALNLIGAVGSLDSVPPSPAGGTTGPSGH